MILFDLKCIHLEVNTSMSIHEFKKKIKSNKILTKYGN